MSHPSTLKVPAPSTSSLTHSDVPSSLLTRKGNPSPASLISSSKYVGNTDMGATQGRTLNHLHSSYQWAGPTEMSPRRNPSHTPHARNPHTPSERKPRVSGWTEPPSVGTPAVTADTKPGRTCGATRPGRVTSSSNTESIVDTEEVVPLVSGDGATASPAGSRPARLPGPRPSSQLLFGLRRHHWNSNRSGRHLFPGLLPTETRRGSPKRAVKPTGLARRPGREALARSAILTGQAPALVPARPKERALGAVTVIVKKSFWP